MNFILRVKGVKFRLIEFLKSPQDFKYTGLSSLDKLKNILTLGIMELIILIPIGLIIYGLDSMEVIDLPEHKTQNLFEEMSFGSIFLFAVLLAPFIEEIFFRTFIILRRFYPLLLVIAMTEALGKNKFLMTRKVMRLWTGLFPFLMTLSTLIFAYVHVYNFEDGMAFWMIPLAVSPQIVAGFFLAYARVRYGLLWSMLSHAFVNLILVILTYLVPLN